MNNCQQFPMFEPEMVNKLQTYEVFRCFEAITSQIFAEKANVRGDAPTQLHTGQINDPYYPCSGQPPGLLLGSSTLMVPSHFNEEPLQAPVSVRSRSLSLSLRRERCRLVERPPCGVRRTRARRRSESQEASAASAGMERASWW